MDTQNSNTLTLWENQCSACSKFHRLLAAKIREPWKKYDQAMATARDLVDQGTLELFAGDCPLEDADGAWPRSSTSLCVTICGARAAGTSTMWGPASGGTQHSGE